ncbi:hypothetical protein HMI56_005498 [Coelomomyces lativittatus]|nr:hypothetical protein HMI56_005498 [Coelomomyces lativittatus]
MILNVYKFYCQIDANEDMQCTGLFCATFRIPCQHEIKHYIKDNARFHTNNIHSQWHLSAALVRESTPIPTVTAELLHSPRKCLLKALENRVYEADEDQLSVISARLYEATQTPLQTLLNPDVVTKKHSRLAGSKNRANQRDKLLFEYATGHKCSRCGQPGHNSHTCKKTLHQSGECHENICEKS